MARRGMGGAAFSMGEFALNWFTGEPFGTSFLRRVEGSEVVGSPHDFYIEILLRTVALGSFGTACFDGWAAGGDMAPVR